MDIDNSMSEVSAPSSPSCATDAGTISAPAARQAQGIASGTAHASLSITELEERRLIHRDQSMREQANVFRELRTRLLAFGGEGNFVTLVAPIRYGCGGSFVARNLAAAFAFDETKSALLIDCDARHPEQARAMRIHATNGGLMEYLEDDSADLADMVYPSGLARLQVLPIARSREASGEALSSLRMRAMIDSLRSRQSNRYLILDAPPVEGSPDTRILSALADIVVLVAGHGAVTPVAIDKAVATFPAEKVAGVVFNQGV